MRIDLSDVYSSDRKIRKEEVNIDITNLDISGESYQVTKLSSLDFKFENVGTRKVHMTASFCISLLMSCDRCLSDVSEDLEINYETDLVRGDEDVRDDEDEIVSFADGNELDVVELVKICVLMNMPSKVLCHADCKGLCPVCGNNLNLHDCGCDSFVPDPRMARIADIFNASNKEV